MVSVIFSTYNAEEWLQKTLWGFAAQTYMDFEVVIADDGSGPKTKAVIERLKPELPFQLKHMWQEDDGFQKTKILNKAITASAGDYLVFTDGDCIPRKDFLQQHITRRKAKHFLSGGYFKLPMSASQAISKADILTNACFDVNWLVERGLKKSFKTLKLSSGEGLGNFLNAVTTTKATWNGHNSSGWRDDIVAVNGFDERMQYGGEDRELGERMMNNGVRGIQIRYSAVCLHLDHARGYVSEEAWAKNKAIRESTRQENKVWTEFGIRQD